MSNNKHVYLADQVISKMMGRISFIDEDEIIPFPLRTDEEFIRNYIAQVECYSVLCHISDGFIFEVVVMDWMDFLSKDEELQALCTLEEDENEESDNYLKDEMDDDDIDETEELGDEEFEILAKEYFDDAIEIIHDTFGFDVDPKNMMNIITEDISLYVTQYQQTTILLMFNENDEYRIRTVTW